MKCCFFKKKIIPIPTKQTNDIKEITTDEFLSEIILCGTCNKAFPLRDNKISAMCGGCNKFLHCGIAGNCIGPNCGNSFHRLTWCKHCIPKNIIINLIDLGPGKECLCKECLDDPKTPSCYKRMM